MSADKLKATLTQLVKSKIAVQTAWVTCKSVDWEAKTMVCTGTLDDLDYFDVLLGLNAIQIKPVEKSKCLIGILGNNTAATFIIWCNEAELIQFNKGEKGGIPISQKVADRTNTVEQDINDLKQMFSSWVVAPQDGGLALKTATASWYSSVLTETQEGDIANEKIKQ